MMQLVIVPDVIQEQELTTLVPEASVLDAVSIMAERHIGTVLVTREGVLEGIFTERDVSLRVVAPGRDPQATFLSEVMTKGL